MVIKHQSLISKIVKSSEIRDALSRIKDKMIHAFAGANKLLLCDNGGCAAYCMRTCRSIYLERKALDAEALNVNTSSLTAIDNDYSIERIFSRQVEAKGRPGDVLIGITDQRYV
ncbi:MAG: SIS domain-containing protein [Chitinispirillaceae bacterium]|nr:SIS domain-containing protein [Chitinispirillaceae bacterium]